MKKRVFYVINLDRGRILMMSVLIIGFLLIAFATGYRFGTSGAPDLHANRESHNDAFMDPARQGLDRSVGTTDIDAPKLASPGDLTTLPEVEKTQPKPETRVEQKEKPQARPRDTHREEKRTNLSDKRQAKPEKTNKPVKPTRAEKLDRNEKADRTERRPKPESAVSKPEKPRAEKPQATRPPKSENKPAKVQASEKNRKPAPGEAARLEPTGALRLANVPASTPSSSLQLGTFTSRDAANRMSDQLKKQGFDAGLVQANGKFSVRVGKSSDDADLKRLEEKLRQKNYSPIRVRIP